MRSTLVVLVAATLYLTLSGFDCASLEMSTAKLALQNKDYPKAEASLRKEVAARPQNGEAWLLLAEIQKETGKFKEMLEAYDKALVATDPALKPQQKENVHASIYNVWLDNFESARSRLSDGRAQNALEKINNAIVVRPDYPDNVYLRSLIYRELKDEAMEETTELEYVKMIAADAEKGMKAGLMLGMARTAVDAKLGKPFKSEIDSTGGYSNYRDQDLYVYYDGESKVDGWRYYAGSTTPDFIREARPYPLRSAPHYSLGISAYYKGESNKAKYDEALKYLQFVQRFDMRQDRVGQVIADLYSRTNRTDEARRSFEESIKQSPNDASLYINYGSLLVNLKEYTGAVANFQKVLTLVDKANDKYHTALFNLGAVYKNWAREANDAAGGKPNKAQSEDITNKIRESAKYFEQYRAVHGDADFTVLVELANLYLVLNDKPKFNQMVSVLEGLKADHGGDADYWSAMSRLYVLKGDNKAAEDALKRADELNGR